MVVRIETYVYKYVVSCVGIATNLNRVTVVNIVVRKLVRTLGDLLIVFFMSRNPSYSLLIIVLLALLIAGIDIQCMASPSLNMPVCVSTQSGQS